MIRLKDVWRTYEMGEEVLHALAEIDLHVEDGEHIAIMGPSGSGKSTLLNLLGCLDQPTKGQYWLDGEEVAQLDADQLSHVRLHKIGFVFQAFHLIPRLSAVANIELPLIFEGTPPSERRERAVRALESVGLGRWANHRPSELSGGQKQRVAVARAMIMDPHILLADEPTGNLDSTSGGQILELLGDLNRRGKTLIVVTHDPLVARRANRVLVLGDGRIVRDLAGGEVADLAALFADADSGAHPAAIRSADGAGT